MDIDLEVLPARRRGRPSSYKSSYCDRVLYLAAEGCGKAEIAVGLGVSVKTLNAWAATYNDFREAMSDAKELEYAWWLAVGRKGQFTRNWNGSAWALQMRNRFRKRFCECVPAKDETAHVHESAQRFHESAQPWSCPAGAALEVAAHTAPRGGVRGRRLTLVAF